jgi:hypothetical protein
MGHQACAKNMVIFSRQFRYDRTGELMMLRVLVPGLAIVQ